MGAMLVVVTTSRTSISITEIELEENIRRKELTPGELSKEMVRKAAQVAPPLSSATEDKKPRGHRRTYAAPKAEVAEVIGVSTDTLVNAEQHVAAMERYPVLWCVREPCIRI
jgi:DNA-binding XRE family transcriptional regulator